MCNNSMIHKKNIDINLKKIRWFLKNIAIKSISIILSLCILRHENYIMFNGKFGKNHEIFLHNTKYLFLYMTNLKEFKVSWLCDNKDMIKIFKEYGYNNIYSRKSIQGLYYSLKSKYWFHDFQPMDLPKLYTQGAKLINLWHGTGSLKKCANDDEKINPYSGIQEKIYNYFLLKDNYYNVDSEHEGKYRKQAFYANDNQIVINGSPRLDILYKDIKNTEIFMQDDFNKIKNLKTQGRKLFFYVPTFRDTEKDISGWLKSKQLDDFLSINNAVLVCKLHPFDTNSLNFELSENFYKMNSDSDLYVVLKYMDAMISDYSSVYFDFLLLDRPIIYYVPDLEEFQKECRGFYEPYEKLTAGVKAYNEDELIKAMQCVINGVDNYKEDRKILRDQTFKYQDGKNCERVVEWIKSLN